MNNRKIGFVYDTAYLEHVPPNDHPERPDRLRHLVEHLKRTSRWEKLHHLKPIPGTEQQILAVHSQEHFDYVRRVCEQGGGMLDEGDTHASAKSYEAALLAAGGVLTAIDALLSGETDVAFCAVRPPGHHAEKSRPMGFCLFNNVAVAARYAQRRYNEEKIAIVDWDVHHGNGTQHIFEDDPSVLYISLHQYPFYPGTGARNETGIGKGKGYTLNIPLPAGTGQERYLQAFTDEIIPALERYKPDLLIISAGFDAHRDDPLAGMMLTEESFAMMTALVKTIAPVVSVLEGGYNLEALARSVESHLVALDP